MNNSDETNRESDTFRKQISKLSLTARGRGIE